MVQIELGVNAMPAMKSFGGLSGQKLCIIYQGDRYLVKLPGSLSQIDLKGDLKSYTNSPVCEFIGSQIYEIFGVPTHETQLARYGDKMVVMCKDFVATNQALLEYKDIRIQYVKEDIDENLIREHSSNLNIALDLCKKSDLLNSAEGITMRLFEMITIDGLIGNPDRNNGNWGILVNTKTNNVIGPAPVFDNGGCLFNRFSDNKMNRYLASDTEMLHLANNVPQSYFCKDNGKRYSPFKLLQSGKYPLHVLVAKGLFKTTHLSRITDFISSIKDISDVQKQFYNELIRLRYIKYTSIINDLKVDISELSKQYGISEIISEDTLIDMYRYGIWRV